MEWFAEYVGMPFVTGGRVKTGCDCYGLVAIVLREHFDITLPELKGNYNDALDNTQTSLIVSENVPLLSGEELDTPEVGAVVVLTSRGLAAHVGVMVTEKLMLHTTSVNGAVIEAISSPRIKNTIRGIYRVDKKYSTK